MVNGFDMESVDPPPRPSPTPQPNPSSLISSTTPITPTRKPGSAPSPARKQHQWTIDVV
jgi:hypothetical protein